MGKPIDSRALAILKKLNLLQIGSQKFQLVMV